ncbi:Transcriptional regulator, TetR family OS=Tsukamurella paurometabola (strain ATCC 8368 / DSM/ CCUG 35730 / CIP 100753 / JCM 10117 / KCTC 9821 / NBRC 16120/ NCIMB 702349 / NCTC 13040) OX=521096 GN=Tpau_2746 PE=4 SV=1 [Tsukamurella paurometabola]|uniref:Transcriptional regulator, TetR family n=1 Tax=Tsukamurella paurometabola (strain ATCC 8368 / DSM 20162 / CCUG 35730 / CIP 100753 / JCM 10117 / KCTC 9821 / NBRC 16120 / NCIMB 702349 / NCTC 13040) TaxID=521096 RepID=D5USS3_TSUPD|nr:TetR family transcriptional regulator [Tsukamurella paurometabola]ADG79344.1 transcriptional regulator, TetR family [Tsukamurella paurometabola DSM 20162]SUP35172.1 Bacterial regulatory proteins, tetR family [Tsukamurella paurometabola]
MTALATGNDLPAAKPTARDQALDAVSAVLRGNEWSAVTMAAVARTAGVSRQTLYNEFGSRKGLAVAYVTRFVDGLLAFVRQRVEAHPGDIDAAIEDAMRGVFEIGMGDPVVVNIAGPNPHRDLVGIVTVDGTPILKRASEGLAEILALSWAQVRRADAQVAAGVLVRLAFSHLTMPLEGPEDAAHEVATALSPFFDRALRA